MLQFFISLLRMTWDETPKREEDAENCRDCWSDEDALEAKAVLRIETAQKKIMERTSAL